MPRSDSTAPKAPDLSTVLATPLLDILDLPPRIASFAYSEGLETIGDLARIPPDALLAERNLGRKSVSLTRRILEERTGVAWEDIACPKAPSEPPEDPDPSGWDAVRRRLSDAHRCIPLAELDLPVGLRQRLERRGVFSLGELSHWSRRDLLDVPGVGRRTLVKLPARVTARIERLSAEHGDRPLLHAFLRAVDDLEEKRRFIVRARIGMEGPPLTMADTARALELTPERVRQLEQRAASALRERSWAQVARHNFDLVLREGPVPFAFIANEPWWATAIEQPPLVSFVVERVLEDLAQVVHFDGAHWLSRHSRDDLEETWLLLLRALEEDVSNVDVDVDALLAIAVERLGPCRHVIDRFLDHHNLRSA